MILSDAELNFRLQRIRLLLLDVDGVLTNGTVVYNDDGHEIKYFNVKDGLGIRLLMEAGVLVGIVTGRRAPALIHRCNNLGIKLIFDGVDDKASILGQIVKLVGIETDHVAFLGDDLPDLPIMNRVGLAVAVADASEIVREKASVVTIASGGSGAVRELAESILKAKGMWQGILDRYLA